MFYFYNTIIAVFILTLVLNYLSFYSKKSAIQTVNDMGIGYNLGNTFNNFVSLKNNYTQDYQIKIWGTHLPTKKIISKIKKYGFKTIRFQISYSNSTDELGKVSSEWISGIKEIIKWIINTNMYCILSIYFDSKYWRKKNIREKYINFWKQISKEFINFDNLLIIEFMTDFDYEYLYEDNNPNDDYYDDYNNYHMNFLNSTQIFVNIMRNSGGFNAERLLIIPGLTTEVEISLYSFFYELELPIDPANKLAVSLNYYFPSENYQNFEAVPFDWYNKYGNIYETNAIINWGSDINYKEMMKNIDFLRKNYIDNEIPVIIGQVGIITEKDYNINSLREFLYVIFSISSEIEGLMSCLWDISEKIENSVYYYNKEEKIWTDELIRDNIIKISKGDYVHPLKYYYDTNIETQNIPVYGILDIDIGTKKVSKIIINAKIMCDFHMECEFVIITADKNGDWYDIIIEDHGKKQYDGTSIFTVDVSNKDCNDHIETIIYYGNNEIIINNITVEYKEYYSFFDYNSYKSAVFNELN